MHIQPGCAGILFSILCFFFLFALLPNAGNGQVSARNAYIIPVSGTVDPGMAAFIRRTIEKHSNDSEALFILELDTFGGRIDSALQIVDTLLSIPKEKTIAFVKTKAISAGALIALACGKLAMRENTSIGDCAPITYSSRGPKMLGEKFQSPIRAKFRALAKRNGYPETLAESMVTAEMEVYAVETDGKTLYFDSRAFENLSKKEKDRVTSKRTIVAKGELLTMTDTEAVDYGFSKMSVDNIKQMLERMEIRIDALNRIEKSWSEVFLRMIGSISPLLLMVGLAALYIEMKAPGFGVPGIVGIICLALVFFNQYLIGLADYTELLLFVLGLILLGFEVFVIPGFGIAGIAGILSIAAGAILALQDFVIPDPALPWQAELLTMNVLQVLGAFFMALVVALVFLRYVLPRFSVVTDGPYLYTTLKGSRAVSREAGRVVTGDIGMAMTLLRPSGKARIGGDTFDVITEGEFIEKGTPITVFEIKGNRIIVSRKPVDE